MVIVLSEFGVIFLVTYILSKTLPAAQITTRIGSSTRTVDDRPEFFSQNIVAICKSLYVAVMSNRMLLSETSSDPSTVVSWFVAFEMADFLFLWHHSRLSAEMMFHHIVYMSLGVCHLSTRPCDSTTLLLLAQETSSVPLNVYLLVRNRGLLKLESASFVLFALLFVGYRLGLGGIALFVSPMPYTLVLAIGYALQWRWACMITKTALRYERRT